MSRIERVTLRRLKLAHFRNYTALDLAFDGGHVVLTGHNGAGKTNLLEALSLLSPGRGLRRANYQDMVKNSALESGFAVHATLECALYGDAEIGTGVMTHENARKVRINGATMSAETLSDYCRVSWLVPSMDGLFTGSSGDRRRFLDRMVLSIDPAHGRRVADYEKSMRARNRLLGDGSNDLALFSAVEHAMAELATAIAAARVELVHLLRDMTEKLPDNSPFPKADFALEGVLEVEIAKMSALDVEERFRLQLEQSRALDRAAGRTLQGVHRTDFIVFHRPKNMAAALCSTGEQKALLTGLILSHARLTADLSGMTPLLLLDEMAAHLDEQRRAALFDILDDLNGQAVMTGTDMALFSALQGRAQFFDVMDSQVVVI